MRAIVAILCLTIFMAGCNKSEDNLPTSSQAIVPNWSFSAKVDGVWSYADSARGYMVIDSSNGFPVRGLIIDGHCLEKLIVPSFGDFINSTTLTTLNYNTVAAGAQFQYYLISDSINTYSYVEASFRISAVDTLNMKISGDFSGVLVGDVVGDTVRITDGTFTNIIYQML